ncbi:MAG: carbon starvation CstA family protein [Flavobacteriales bacterium AspAUS03]
MLYSFEVFFILTTIDAGTRVLCLIIHDLLERLVQPISNRKSWSANVIAILLAICGWEYFLYQSVIYPLSRINILWHLFSIINQIPDCIFLILDTIVFIKMKSYDMYGS